MASSSTITVSDPKGKRPASSPDEADDATTTTTSPSSPNRNRAPPHQQQQQSQPPNKRRRVADNARVRSAKACQRCRRLKEKCDGQQPCQRCLRARRECEFSPAANLHHHLLPPRPERADDGSGSRSSSNNSNSAMIAETTRLEERAKCLETLVQHLLGDVPMDLNNLRRMAEKAGQRTGGPGSEAGASVRAGTEDLDDLTLEDENFTVKTLSQSTAHYSGEFSHWNFSQKLRRRLSQCLDAEMPPSPIIKRDPTSSTSFTSMAPPRRMLPPANPTSTSTAITNSSNMRILEYWRATQLQSPKTLVQSVLSCLPPRSVAGFLVHIYFQFAQVNCFYVEQGWLRKKLDFLYEAPGHVTSEDAGWVCSVLMVLAIGTQFAHMAAGGGTAAAPEPGVEGGESSSGGGGGDGGDGEQEKGPDADVGVTFYQMASKLIPDIITIASMESVQACLLLAHYALPLDTHGLAYTYLGLGIKMAIQNGMHRRYTGTDLDARTIETRNRLWWTAYTVERRVSVLHGRPPSIAATEVDAELPKDLPEFRQYDSPSKFSNMSAFIDMTLRLGDVANAITLLRRCPKNLQPTYFERIVDICHSLQTWWSTLPAETQHPAPSHPLFRSAAHLKLSLHLNDIFVGRPFILSAPSSSSSTSIPSPAASSSSQQPRTRTRAALVSRAVLAAKEAVTLLKTLHETVGLARSSYTEFSACRAALLVLLAQSVVEDDSDGEEEERGLVEVGMGLIRRMAAGNVSTRSETSVIEALEIAVRRLRERARRAATEAAGDRGEGRMAEAEERNSVDVAKSGYERFREWASLGPVGVVNAAEMDAARNYRGGGGNGAMSSSMGSGYLTGGSGFTVASSVMGMRIPEVVGSAHNSNEQYSPESARWLTLMDTPGGMGVGMEQLDDMGLFGGFPELGALDGWPGLS